MTQLTSHFDSNGYLAAIGVIEKLCANGHIAYLAGGCVRDLLLGVDPKDFDVATDAIPAEIAGHFRKTASVGAAFGVMLVRDFGETIEVATFRSDGIYSDARRPDSVEFSSPEQDAHRRDFTINALFFDPHADEASRVIDFVNGLEDVQSRVLRAVGNPDDRLKEDHLRALRAVRFAAKYQLRIDECTKNAIREHAAKLGGVSIERVGEEVRKMLMHPSRAIACKLIDELGLDDAIFGDRNDFDPSVMLGLGEQASYAQGLAALAIGRGFEIDDDMTDGIAVICSLYRKTLDLSNADRDELRWILQSLWNFFKCWDRMGEAGQKRLASGPVTAQALLVLRAIDYARADVIVDKIEVLSGRFGGLCPKPFISGADLIELGLEPRPMFKAALDAVYDEQLEGRVKVKLEAISFVNDFVQKQA